jgi:large subunit ribosomal protein L10
MTKEEKHELVQTLADQMKEYGNFYITDTADLTVEKVNNIRRKCFESDITMQVAKNSLL